MSDQVKRFLKESALGNGTVGAEEVEGTGNVEGLNCSTFLSNISRDDWIVSFLYSSYNSYATGQHDVNPSADF